MRSLLRFYLNESAPSGARRGGMAVRKSRAIAWIYPT